MNQPALTRAGPELDLAGLDALLRAHGMLRGPDDWQAVHDLLWLRGRRQGLPTEPARLARLLGPLLCHSREEQQRFPYLVEQWCTGRDALSHAARMDTIDPKPWHSWKERLRKFDRRQIALTVVLVTLITTITLRGLSSPPIETTIPQPLPPPKSETTTKPVRIERPSVIPIDDRAPPNLRPLYDPLPKAWEVWRERAGYFAVSLPWLAMLPWLYGRYRRQRIIDTGTPDGNEPIEQLRFDTPRLPLYGGSRNEEVLGRLGTARDEPTRRIDIAATVDATARQGGYFIPCYQARRLQPVYQVLVRCHHGHDQQSRLAEELIQRLKDAGLETEAYRFLDNPSYLVPWPASDGQAVRLTALADRHELARLLVISDGGILFHPGTGEPRPWLVDFEPWEQRVWLGIGEIDATDMALLFQQKFLYLPLESASLEKLAEFLLSPIGWEIPPPNRERLREPLPASIADYPQRWLSPHPPTEVPLSRLLADLRKFLQADGWSLLQALVAFPMCRWNLILAVDHFLFVNQPEGHPDEKELRLTRLMKLPWLNHSYFPRYLREHVLREASDAERENIRMTWQQLLGKRFGEGIDVRVPDEQALRDLGRSQRGGALGDPIFLQILRGKPLDFWHFRLPQALEAFFNGRGRTLWNVRPLLLAGWVACAASFGLHWLWQSQGKTWLTGIWQQQIAKENGRWPVQIVAAETTRALAAALPELLQPKGFRFVPQSQTPTPTALADRLVHPPAAAAVAARLAGFVRQAGYGIDPQLQPQADTDGIRLELARSYQALATLNDPLVFPSSTTPLPPGKSFHDTLKDGSPGPELLIVPSGQFQMGSPASEKGRDGDEDPQHSVTLAKAFAIGRDEVTFDDYDRFARATGKPLPDDRGWGRGTRPVINVSWNEAQAYVQWLSAQTGQTYRLPSEAEWEYAARATTTTPYWWGDSIRKNGKVMANCDGCGSDWGNRQTAPVGSFDANSFGLRDTAGNVWEWTADCWHDSYRGAPTDGSAWDAGKCDRRVVRGGSWLNGPQVLRSADRYWNGPDAAGDILGFRVARAL